MPAGRPLKFESKEELENKINEYFSHCDKVKKPYTIAGMAIYIGCSRDTIYEYEKNKDRIEEYSDTIKKARDKILAYLEEKLMMEGKPGQIFIAKNYGYTDKQEIESSNTNLNTDLTSLSPDERQKRINELLSKRNGN